MTEPAGAVDRRADTREQTIAEEQKAVHHAYDCYEARLAELTDNSAARASASGKDGVANRVASDARAAAYGGLDGEALVISRVDLREGAGQETETLYVGRRPVSDVRTRDTVVVVWTSPLARSWFEALPENPGDIVLRRQLRCSERIVEDYRDEIALPPAPSEQPSAPVGDLAEPPPAEALPDPAASEHPEAAGEHGEAPAAPMPRVPRPRTGTPTPGDVARIRRRHPVQPDDFLLRELQRSRSGRMRDIVETIRRDQMALVTGSPTDILVVQGGPGTGKTAVGLHRVTWLVDNDHFRAQDILVVGPHQHFLEYVGRVLPTLGTRDVNAVQLSRLWEGDVRGVDSDAARLVKSDERMAAVLRRRVEGEYRPGAVDTLTTAASFEGDEPVFTVTVGSTTLRVARSEVVAAADAALAGDGSYRERRDRFRSRLVDLLLQELVAVAPRRSRDTSIRRDLERNRRVERLVERVWPSPGAREALRTLYDSPDLLRACSDGLLDDRERAALHRPRAAKAADEPWTLDDRVCLEELRHLIDGESPRRYGHIVVDEAQDLTPMQALSLRRRCAAGGSMTVLGDLAQATGPHPYRTWDRLGTLLSDHGDWQVEELTTSYRVPSEVMEFVAPLARAAAPGLPVPLAVRSAGADAARARPTGTGRLQDDAVAEVTRLLGTDDGHTLRSIAVVAPEGSAQLDGITQRLEALREVGDEERRVVSVLTAAETKGMEYDHVLVVEPTAIADGGTPAGLRRLYIALTRGTQSLTVLHTTPLPSALLPTEKSGGAPDETDAPADTTAAPSPASRPDIGTDVRVRVLGHTGGGNYKVEAVEPPLDGPLLLAVRHGSAPPAVGSYLDTWVLRHTSTVSFVTVGGLGRTPVSTRMAARYLDALATPGLLAGGTVPDGARARLSELKGMANRCLRLDQHDWLDVWRLLGSPDRERLGALRDLATAASRALASGAHDPAAFREHLEHSGWAEALGTARQRLQERNAERAATDTAEGSGPEEAVVSGDGAPPGETPSAEAPPAPLGAAESPTSPNSPEAKEQPMPLTATDGTPAAASQTPGATSPLAYLLRSEAAEDRTCKDHEAARYGLIAHLFGLGAHPVYDDLIDIHLPATSGSSVLFEVLGADRTHYADLRAGASRLREIDHTNALTADRYCLVLTGPPGEPWAAEALRAGHGVDVIWQAPDGTWPTPKISALLSPG
ncbi:ATP-dependent DNA helicase [Streptomyces sp. NPDC058373]|uniref:HelD family protein n=1 Tax=unclassified Streptomyces TaxID=2593676 RepID=UPI00364EC4A5